MVEISLSAEEDLQGIASHIALDKPSAANKWLDRIQETFEMLDSNPSVGELRTDFSVQGCRSFTFRRYVIFFRQVESGIQIARVIHGSRDLRNQ